MYDLQQPNLIFQIQAGGKDNQRNDNHNHLLSLDNVGFIHTIDGCGEHVEPKFCSTGFNLNF